LKKSGKIFVSKKYLGKIQSGKKKVRERSKKGKIGKKIVDLLKNEVLSS